MDNQDLTGLRTQAETSSRDLGTLQTSVPGMLKDLRSAITSIYAKDNPIIQARDTALANYLSAGDQARAEYLPANQPMVANAPLNYSPTQLNAMVSSRESAALAPLLGLNQAVMGGYGNIGDIVSGTGTGLQAMVDAAKTQASNALTLYNYAIQEAEMRRKAQEGAGGGFSLADIEAMVKRLYGQGAGTTTGRNLGDIVEPDQPVINNQPSITQVPSFATIQQPVNNSGLSYNAAAVPSNISFWDSLLGLIGATPRQGLEQPAQPIQQPVQQPSLWNYQNATEIANRGRG